MIKLRNNDLIKSLLLIFQTGKCGKVEILERGSRPQCLYFLPIIHILKGYMQCLSFISYKNVYVALPIEENLVPIFLLKNFYFGGVFYRYKIYVFCQGSHFGRNYIIVEHAQINKLFNRAGLLAASFFSSTWIFFL